ncbi:nucleotidyltransferase domain-containing protein [Candidatus Pacearchaeota archaeon]|nr:nucleotidyltransferase domain-containing protein [Candidatus Pacearchaeota archaeon]
MKPSKEQEIIRRIFKDFQTSYNSRSISKLVGLSHVGAFKILKKIEKKGIASSKKIGNAVIYSLNLANPLARKEIELSLLIDAQNHKRWLEEFKDLENISDFVVLFGSVIRSESSAKDIDVLVVAERSNFSKIKEIIKKRNEVSNKKIHLILQEPEEFKKDLDSRNKAILEIIKTGIVLFGQDNFVRKIK